MKKNHSGSNKKSIVIVGGGAAGLMAACSAGQHTRAAEVTILETGDRVGRKILATGNGRCNLTNMDLSPAFYHGTESVEAFVTPAITEFGADKAIGFFSSIGLLCRTEEGRVYPYCNQASAVLDVLRNEAGRLGAVTVTGYDVKRIIHSGDVFRISGGGSSDEIRADSVVIASGGCASPALGSNGGGFKLLEHLGHRITGLYPGLVQLTIRDPIVKGLKGMRFFGRITLLDGDRSITSARGEMLFTEYGVSGIPVMEVSSHLKDLGATAVIDFLPDEETRSLERNLWDRAERLSYLNMEEFLTGLLNKRIGQALVKRHLGIKLSQSVKSLNKEQICRLAYGMKNLMLPVTGTNGFANAQVTVGGAALSEFSPYTMESKRVKGLFAAGEVLDINGDCGGYNLHWAWASGYIAGRSAADIE